MVPPVLGFKFATKMGLHGVSVRVVLEGASQIAMASPAAMTAAGAVVGIVHLAKVAHLPVSAFRPSRTYIKIALMGDGFLISA